MVVSNRQSDLSRVRERERGREGKGNEERLIGGKVKERERERGTINRWPLTSRRRWGCGRGGRGKEANKVGIGRPIDPPLASELC